MSTPVILLGGRENTLSATRTFGRLGARVMVIGYAGDFALRSRYCLRGFEVSPGQCLEQVCRTQLLENSDEDWLGAVIFPCSDEAIEFVANNDSALRDRYVLEPATPSQRLKFLDKRATLELAAEGRHSCAKLLGCINTFRTSKILPVRHYPSGAGEASEFSGVYRRIQTETFYSRQYRYAQRKSKTRARSSTGHNDCRDDSGSRHAYSAATIPT